MTTAEPTPTTAPQSSGGAGFLATKLGPLPLWAWGAAGIAVLLYIRMRSNAATAAAAPVATDTAGASQIPQFINQTYTTVTPPVADPEPAPPGGPPVVKPPVVKKPILLPPVKKPPIKVVKPPVVVKPSHPAPVPPHKAPVAPRAVVYTVVAGDNLSSIAARYNTTWQTLWNNNRAAGGGLSQNTNPNLIYAGQKIVVG